MSRRNKRKTYRSHVRSARPVSVQYEILKRSGINPSKRHIKKLNNEVYVVRIAGQDEYLSPSRMIVWRDDKYGWSKYDPRKRGRRR